MMGQSLVPILLVAIPHPWILAPASFWNGFTGALMWTWGQRRGRWQGEKVQLSWSETADDLKQLLGNPRFWALVLSLCVMGGSLFQANNQFLRYRAEDLGLISGAQDRGWIMLQELKVLMWIPGGLAVGLLAGWRAAGLAGAVGLLVFDRFVPIRHGEGDRRVMPNA